MDRENASPRQVPRPLRALLDLIYPPRCPFCGRLLERGEEEVCGRCRRTLPYTGGARPGVDLCDACLAPLWYRNETVEAVQRYKFSGKSSYADAFGGLMTRCLQENWSEPLDAVVWAPLSRRHLRRRGYDQAELLARRVGALTGLPVMNALEKRRNTGTQSSLSGDAERRANVSGAYRLRPGVSVDGLRLVLVDDVVTSGATLSECAAVLRMSGAAVVVGLALARAR